MDKHTQSYLNLSIIFWNSNGITNKRNEFSMFASVHNPDIIIVTETKKINDEKPPPIKGYEAFTKTDKHNEPAEAEGSPYTFEMIGSLKRWRSHQLTQKRMPLK